MKNRTNTKKLLALGMATIFALTMAGCGTQDNSGATGSAADQTVGSPVSYTHLTLPTTERV